VKQLVDIPLVMHGGSGVSTEDYKNVIKRGIRKINYYTYMAKAGGTGVESKLQVEKMPLSYRGKDYDLYYYLEEKGKEKVVYYHDIVDWGIRAMKEDVKRALKIFSGKE